VPIYPGDSIREVMANSYPDYKSFRLKNGRHVIYEDLDIDLDGVALYGDWSTELVLASAASRITLSGDGCGLWGCSIDHETVKYSTDMVRVSGQYCSVRDVKFENADDSVIPSWPLRIMALSNTGQYIGNVFVPRTTPGPPAVHIYADDTAANNLFISNHLGIDNLGARNQISVLNADLNEAGQSVAGAGTSPSHSNYCDVEARP